MNAYASTRQETGSAIDQGLRAHMNKVYGTMSVGLLLTFLVAWAVGSSPDLFALLRDPQSSQPNFLGWIVMLLPMGMVLLFNGIHRMSAAAVRTLFYALAAVMGLSMSWIFVAFTGFSIAQVFLISSISFASLSLWGYTTKSDISGWGSFLFMGIVGLIVASILTLIWPSPGVHFAINAIGVLIFSAYTAYDAQKIKLTYLSHAEMRDQEWLDKAATLGALDLFLDMINLFVHLLNLLGHRK